MTGQTKGKIPATFTNVDRGTYGYNVAQVDDFMERARAVFEAPQDATDLGSADVRRVAFDPSKGGYDAGEVDQALDLLEDALAHKERDELIQAKGEEAWLTEIGRLSALLRARLNRPDGERFRHPSKAHARGYKIADVDRLCREITDYLENDHALSVDDVRRSVFAPAQGDAGYEESQVDGFLDRVVELMAAID